MEEETSNQFAKKDDELSLAQSEFIESGKLNDSPSKSIGQKAKINQMEDKKK